MSNFGNENGWGVILALRLVVGWVALMAFVIMLLWSWLVPALLPGFVTKGFIAPAITFWQALCLGMFVRLAGFGVSTTSSSNK